MHITIRKISLNIVISMSLLYFLLVPFVVDGAWPPAEPHPPPPPKFYSFNKTAAYESSLAQQFLVPQNQARARLGENPLVWDEDVAAYARWWAEQRRSDCELKHSYGPYGENIFWGSGKNWQPSDAVFAWVSEKKYYDFTTNSCIGDEMCGHYTQIVWKNSRSLGCARVVCYNGQIFMTCNYFPPGNYIGERPY